MLLATIHSINLSHHCHISSWLGVWGGCAIIFCQLFRAYPRKLFFVSITTVQSMKIGCIYSPKVVFAACILHLSSVCRLIWRILSSMCLRSSQFSKYLFTYIHMVFNFVVNLRESSHYGYAVTYGTRTVANGAWPSVAFLLTWVNFYPSMDK